MTPAGHLRLLQTAADKIAAVAGWAPRTPGPDNVVTYRLENGLRLELLCPDGETLILRALIRILPEATGSNDTEAGALIEKTLRLQAALCRKSRAIPALNGSRLELHRLVLAGETAADELDIADETRSFLNDLSWWRKQLAPEESPVSGLQAFVGGTR